MIRAALVALFFSLYMPPACLVAWTLTRLRGTPASLFRVGRFGIRVGLLLGGTRVVLEGVERFPLSNTVVMPNHSSNLDAPVLFRALKTDFKFLVKKELLKVPLLGTTLRLAGFIEVDRSDRAKAKEAVARAVETLKGGACFVIFPEGTRSHTGELGAFKKGAFIAAMEARSRILPVALQGTRELMPRGGLRMRPGTVRVRLLDPVDAGSYGSEDRDRLMADVRSRIAGALGS